MIFVMAPLTGPSGRAGHAESLRGDVTSEIFEKACRDELEPSTFNQMVLNVHPAPAKCKLKKSSESLTRRPQPGGGMCVPSGAASLHARDSIMRVRSGVVWRYRTISSCGHAAALGMLHVHLRL